MAARVVSLAAAAIGISALVASPALAAPNGPPVNTVPGTQMIAEDATVTFSPGNANAISIADPDADPDELHVTLTAAFGRVTITPGSGVTFFGGGGVDNNGVADTDMRIEGTLAQLNAALNGLTFQPGAHHNDSFGQASLTILTDDQGNNGDDGGKTDTDVITINVSAIPDPPQVSVPAGVGTFRDVPRELSLANLNSLTVDEPDDNVNPVNIEMELTATNGTLTLASTAGLTLTGGANGSASMTFTGTDASFTGALNAGLTFTPSPGFTGDATITTDSTDFTDSEIKVTDVRVDARGDMVFWTAAKDTLEPTGSIPAALGRASLSGGGANLVTGPELMDTPAGIAIDAVGGRIYWANTGAIAPANQGIWSASLDGTDKDLFLSKAQAIAAGTTLDSAFNMAIDQETRRIYWANSDNATPADRGISYVSLDAPAGTPGSGGRVDTDPEDDMVSVANVTAPRGLALDLEHDRVYWTNWIMTQGISFAPLPGASGTAGNLAISGLGVNSPSGVAVDLASDPERLFWANGSGTAGVDETLRLRVAPLADPFDPSVTGSALDISPNPGGGLRTPAIDPVADRIYWANSSSDGISYAELDGGGNADNLDQGTAFTNSPDGVTILRAPEALSPPSISGTPQVGSTLACSGGTWAPDQPNAAMYRSGASTFTWLLNGSPVAGATGSTHTPATAGEYGCTQTTTNFAGASTQQSGTVTVPQPAATPSPAAVPAPEDTTCDKLRKKLKKAKSKKQRKKLKRKLRKNDC